MGVELAHLRVAIGFLTRLPMGDVSRAGSVEVSITRAAVWFPAVGSFIGAIGALTYWGAVQQLGTLPSAGLSVGVVLLVTGAFHLDGLADMADAFGGGWTVDRRMEILKDSRLGTYGTAAVVCAVLLEVVLLADVGDRVGVDAVIRFLVAGHALSRTLAVAAMKLGRLAGDGLGASYAADLTTARTIVTCLMGAGIASATLAGYGVITMVGAWLAASLGVIAVGALAYKKIGGLTGDVLGAIQQIGHLSALIFFATTQ